MIEWWMSYAPVDLRTMVLIGGAWILFCAGFLAGAVWVGIFKDRDHGEHPDPTYDIYE